MSLEQFLSAVAEFQSFPDDLRQKAKYAGPKLDEAGREELLKTLQEIHAECEAIETRRIARLEEAMRQLTSMEHQFLPMMHEQIEHEESESALENLTKQMDDSPSPPR